MSLFNNWFSGDDEKLMRSQKGDVPKSGIPQARPVQNVQPVQSEQPSNYDEIRKALRLESGAIIPEMDKGVYAADPLTHDLYEPTDEEIRDVGHDMLEESRGNGPYEIEDAMKKVLGREHGSDGAGTWNDDDIREYLQKTGGSW